MNGHITPSYIGYSEYAGRSGFSTRSCTEKDSEKNVVNLQNMFRSDPDLTITGGGLHIE